MSNRPGQVRGAFPRSRGRSRTPWRVLLALAVLVPTLVVVGSTVSPVSRAGADAASPVVLSATPTTQLTDGQSVNINVKTSADFPVSTAEVHVCRPGVTYQSADGSERDPAFALDGPNCPLAPMSSSAESSYSDPGIYEGAVTPDGETFSIRVGPGNVTWRGLYSLVCDTAHPCLLVVEYRAAASGQFPPFQYWTQPISFQDGDPVASCGGAAPGAITSAASDRLTESWVAWTLDACKGPSRSGALTTASFSGEGAAVQAFNRGQVDLAYTAAGNDEQIDLNQDQTAPGARRPSVAVPIAVNATVLAVGGGRPDRASSGAHRVPFHQPELTLDEVATMIGGGKVAMTEAQLDAIRARPANIDFSLANPLHAPVFFSGNAPVAEVQGPAEAEASSWFGTNTLHTLRPDAFEVPNIPLFGSDAGRQRGADVALALADPSYSQALGLFSGRPVLRKTLISDISGPYFGGLWILTDAATAAATGLVPVAIENSVGEFVAPTADTMSAGVATMTTAANGMLQPNPQAAAPVGQAQPYDMTFVEYAMVPAEPLVDATCAPRTGSQALLVDWLNYVTGAGGQQALSGGLQPLTPALQAEAAAAIAKVGASPTTCVAPPTTPTTVSDSGGSPSGGFGSGGLGSSADFSNSSASSGSSSSSSSGAEAAAAADAELASSSTDIPGWAGGSLPSTLLAAVALLGLVMLTAASASVTSGRRWNGRPRSAASPSASPSSGLPPPPAASAGAGSS